MKKLIVHIGYHKTATTTMQKGLFVKLHDEGLINYLGIADKDNNNNFRQASIIRDYLIFNQEFNTDDIYISSQKLNVLSNEIFTLNLLYLIKRRDRDEFKDAIKKNAEINDTFLLPEKLVEFFSNKVDDLEILVTLRNQQSLIYSHYIQDYRFFANDPDNNTIEKHIFFNNNNQLTFKKKVFSILYFADLIKKYTDIIGKHKVHILLFEDFQQNNEIFLQQLSKIIGIDYAKVKSLLKEIHYNKKAKTDIGYIAKIPELTAPGKLFKKLKSNKFAKNIYIKIKKCYGNINLLARSIERFSYRKKSKLIPKLSKAQQNIIFNEFRENNLRLHKDFGIDHEKLKAYGYI